MRIIIAGAGDVGSHLAKLLSQDAQDITVIDTDKDRLKTIESQLDVISFRGDSTSFGLLKRINVANCDIFIAVTELQNTNLASALIAKRLGAKRAIARVNNPEFLIRENALAIRRVGVDALISPEELAAHEIFNLIEQSAFNEFHMFENGELNLFGFHLGEEDRLVGKSVRETRESWRGRKSFNAMALVRRDKEKEEYKAFIPRGGLRFEENDQLYFLAEKGAVSDLYKLLGKKEQRFKNIIVLGGGRIGKKTSQLLKESRHSVKIIERDEKVAMELADEFRDILIINGDGREGNLLQEEGIHDADAFIAVTGSSETNIMSCLLAKSKGVKKTIALVENIDYIHLSQEAGIDAFINKKLLAANTIIRHVRHGDVIDVTTLSDVSGAEVLEFKVTAKTKCLGKKIKDMNFPRDAVIGGLIRKKKGYITTGDLVLKQNDRVVVFSTPEALNEVAQFF